MSWQDDAMIEQEKADALEYMGEAEWRDMFKEGNRKSLYFAYYQDHDGVQYWGHYITNSAEEAINELLKENGDIDIYYSKFVRAIDLSDKIERLKEENDV